jgi:outer membrane receptor protein involved in Fe transport
MKRCLLAAAGAALLFALPLAAQDADDQQGQTKVEGEQAKREEQIVVSASKNESTIQNAPVTMSVVSAETIATSAAQSVPDVLRSEVPGVNVIQMSARDFNLTSRQATSTLSNSQLALLDGRSIYLDFFGLILWDLIPTNLDDIKQIEVVRGPASAVWGANALTGLVNIITKAPAESVGTTVSLNGGFFEREKSQLQDDGAGYLYGATLGIARKPSDRFAWKLTAGYASSDAYSRPEGFVGGCPPLTPCVPHPLDSTILTGGAPYPLNSGGGAPGTAFPNDGTKQPRVNLRLDQELSSGGRITYEGGYAGTQGIIHTGIGPFQIESGSFMAYGRVGFTKDRLKVNAFANFLDADAPNLLLIDPNALPAIEPVFLSFKTQTYDLEIGHSTLLGSHHILSYGGNARRNNFDISLASAAEDRNEFGAYLQEEFFLDKFRVAVGGRVDKFGNLDDVVFSPRITAMFKPTPDHSFRVSFNRAFRSPSVINNYLSQTIFLPSPLIDLRRTVPLAAIFAPSLVPALSRPFNLIVNNVGNDQLEKESLDAWEIAYTGTFQGRTTMGFAIYRNDSEKNVNFTRIVPSAQFPQGLPGFDVYTPANAPAIIGLEPTQLAPVPGAVVNFLASIPPQFGGPQFLPRTVSKYLNLSGLRQEGLEASLDHRFSNNISGFVNYSYQKDPELLTPEAGQIPYPTSEVAIPAKNRVNVGLSFNDSRFLGSLSVAYSDKAFWTDVLSSDFDGYTDSYAMVNATFGVKWADGKVSTSIKGTNLFNETIQQHNYGDILKRSVYVEVRFRVD